MTSSPPDKWGEFNAKYFKACESSQGQHWLEAALAARQVFNAEQKSLAASHAREPDFVCLKEPRCKAPCGERNCHIAPSSTRDATDEASFEEIELWIGEYAHFIRTKQRDQAIEVFRRIKVAIRRLVAPSATERPTYAEITGAVARGWCSPNNEHKVMDPELAFAISVQIAALLGIGRDSDGGANHG